MDIHLRVADHSWVYRMDSHFHSVFVHLTDVEQVDHPMDTRFRLKVCSEGHLGILQDHLRDILPKV